MKKTALLILSTFIFLSCSENNQEKKDTVTQLPVEKDEFKYDNSEFKKSDFDLTALETSTAPIIDGDGSDSTWSNQTWYSLNHRWLGKPFNKNDFQGRYKLSWDKNKLYLLVEIQDDIIIDKEEKWDSGWWNDDCVEIFIDEDNGDDLHQFNHKAFAYHVALNAKDVVDVGPDEKPHLYNNHLVAAKKMKNEKSITWEFAIDIYTDKFVDGSENNLPTTLSSGKTMGFALAYCDSDTSKSRENFIGSIPVMGTNDAERDQGWKDAGIFNNLTLK